MKIVKCKVESKPSREVPNFEESNQDCRTIEENSTSDSFVFEEANVLTEKDLLGLTWRLFQRNSKKDRITEFSFSRLFTDLIKRMDCHEIVANQENMLIFKFPSQDELKRLLNDVDINELKKVVLN